MATKSKITLEMIKQCREPFPPEAYSAIADKTYLTTLKAFYVTERLNLVFGMGRWSIEIEIIERTADYVLFQGEFLSLDYEVIAPKQYGGHKTTGKGTEIADGYKSAFTDCQSKIASYFEIGHEMFKGKIKPAYTKKPYVKPTQQTAPAKPQPTKLKPAMTDKLVTEMALKISAQDMPDKTKWVKYINTFKPSELRKKLYTHLLNDIDQKLLNLKNIKP